MIDFQHGQSPLVISLPHAGREIPAEIVARMTPLARTVPDTDWHVERLYDFARLAGAGWLEARLSRYVVDLNRPPDDAALYPGQLATGLCPTHSFAGSPLYAAAQKYVGALASTAIDYPPMQAPASFNLSAIKAKIEEAIKAHEGQ